MLLTNFSYVYTKRPKYILQGIVSHPCTDPAPECTSVCARLSALSANEDSPNEDLISTVIAMAATPTHDTFASRHPVCHNGKGEGSQCWHEVVTKHGLCLTSDIDGENCTDHMKSFEI